MTVKAPTSPASKPDMCASKPCRRDLRIRAYGPRAEMSHAARETLLASLIGRCSRCASVSPQLSCMAACSRPSSVMPAIATSFEGEARLSAARGRCPCEADDRRLWWRLRRHCWTVGHNGHLCRHPQQADERRHLLAQPQTEDRARARRSLREVYQRCRDRRPDKLPMLESREWQEESAAVGCINELRL